jgi:hypothetical protein
VSANRPAGEAPEHPPLDAPASRSEPVGLTADELEVIRRVRDSLRSIRFGTVLIVVQDGKVVQIETAEKIRLR